MRATAVSQSGPEVHDSVKRGTAKTSREVARQETPSDGPVGAAERNRQSDVANLMRLQGELLTEMRHCQEDLGSDGGFLSEGDHPSQRSLQITLAGTANHIRNRLREVDRALDRVANGSFGRCTDCGRQIPRKRMSINPTAERCIACQTARERG